MGEILRISCFAALNSRARVGAEFFPTVPSTIETSRRWFYEFYRKIRFDFFDFKFDFVIINCCSVILFHLINTNTIEKSGTFNRISTIM